MATLTGQTIASTYKSLLKATSATPALVTGSTTERLVFGEDDAADVRTTIYVSQDRVGIGVADPDSTLEILDTTTQLKLSYDGTNYASFSVAADGLLNIVTDDPDGAEADICLNPDGNVGIGTTAPNYEFEVMSTSGDADIVVTSYNDSASNHAKIALQSSDNTEASPQPIDDDDYVGMIDFNGNGGTGSASWHTGARIQVQTAENFDAVSAGTDMKFQLVPAGENSTTLGTVMTLLNSGKVGIGLSPTANMVGLSIEAGCITLKERATPTADANYGKIYTKTDNKLYFQDGGGTEHEIEYA